MKILCVSLNYTPEQTGIGKYQGEMVEWLAARGHQVRVVTAPPYYPEWKVAKGYSALRYRREHMHGAIIYRVPLYVPATQNGWRRMLHLLSFAAAIKPVMLWQALFWRPDVIFVTEPPLFASPIVLFSALISGARSHLHVQDFEVDAAFQLGLLKRPLLFRFAAACESFLMRRFSAVSTISRRMMEKLLVKGVDVKRTLLIPNWAGIEDFDPTHGPGDWRSDLGVDENTVLAVYAGNMGRKQGLEIIVEAARALRDQPYICFLICGDGAAKQEILASASGLTNIIFRSVQPLEQFAPLMVAADIHLLPQRAEAADLVMPSKLGNMLASGRPVVACAKAGTQIYDVVQGCGIAVEPENAEAFAEAIAMLANDAGKRKAMGAEGRQKALNEWGREQILSRLEASFGEN